MYESNMLRGEVVGKSEPTASLNQCPVLLDTCMCCHSPSDIGKSFRSVMSRDMSGSNPNRSCNEPSQCSQQLPYKYGGNIRPPFPVEIESASFKPANGLHRLGQKWNIGNQCV